MKYKMINLSVAPVRAEDSNKAEMVTQGIFGDLITILTVKKSWAKVKFVNDGYEGWIDVKQFLTLTEEEFNQHKTIDSYFLAEYTALAFGDKSFLRLPAGACLPFYKDGVFKLNSINYKIEAKVVCGVQSREKIVEIAHLYLNTPYLWGGKSIFGIDCSGFSQQVYKICGINIPRDAYQQVCLGKPLSFLEETLPGDLAFFDDEKGNIVHVGIILENKQIIHAYGKVRIDRLDYAGIFNIESKKHTHKLRIIKQLV